MHLLCCNQDTLGPSTPPPLLTQTLSIITCFSLRSSRKHTFRWNHRRQMIMRAARVKSGGDRINSNANTDHRGGTLVPAGEDIASISVKRFPMQHAAQRPARLGTDADSGSRTTGDRREWRKSCRRETFLPCYLLPVFVLFVF